ncbi:hypothetical protein A2U01_0029377 [Trifolium medium]|uniref:Uncharacterized protein n=1 Tax=Trifolium medium TaxID=97028 RepID=A0A392P852_9FABA|nr:hypothetical protein [Trifolium medium]
MASSGFSPLPIAVADMICMHYCHHFPVSRAWLNRSGSVSGTLVHRFDRRTRRVTPVFTSLFAYPVQQAVQPVRYSDSRSDRSGPDFKTMVL